MNLTLRAISLITLSGAAMIAIAPAATSAPDRPAPERVVVKQLERVEQEVASAPARPTAEPKVIAHRGSSGVAPENTVAAVRAAVRQRSDLIENDIQRTRDGVLVVVHDTTLARTTNVEEVFPDRTPWNVGDFTLREIKRLDAGSWFDPGYTGERIPTLTEWGNAVGRRSGMLLEVKSPALYPGIDADLDKELRNVRVFRTALKQGRIVVQSFDHEWLRSYQQRAPEVPVGLLFGSAPTPAQIADAAGWAEQVNPALGAIGEQDVAAIHDAGLEAHVWTVNDGQGMRRAIGWGVDGIITNYPQVLTDILGDRRG